MTLEAYKKLINKETSKLLLKKILIAAKENANKNNRAYDDLIFKPNEIEIIDQIINQTDRNTPFENFIFKEDALKLLDYIIGNIYGNAMAEYTEPITYIADKFNLSFYQDEYETLEDLRHYLSIIID